MSKNKGKNNNKSKKTVPKEIPIIWVNVV